MGLRTRAGLASPATGGLLFDRPSVGCAKSRLVGEHGKVGAERGSSTVLTYEKIRVGTVLRTRRGVKPVYVSPGYLVDRSSSVELVLACTGRFRIPEPIRLAHHATTALRRAHDADVLPVAVRNYPWFVRKTHSGLRND